MEELTLPLIIQGSFLILRHDEFKMMISNKSDPRCDVLYAGQQLNTIPVRSGRKNVLICRQSDYTHWQKADGQRVQLQSGNGHYQHILAVSLHHPHLKLSAKEQNWLKDRDSYLVLDEKHGLLLADPPHRIRQGGRMSLAIDADLAIACGLNEQAKVSLHFKNKPGAAQKNPGRKKRFPLITENDVRKARREARIIHIAKGQLITPAARSLGKEFDILEFDS